MKKEIFLQYVNAVIDIWDVDRDEFFSGSKKKDVVEARQMMYYLCSKRNMRLTNIQKFMAEEGYDPNHGSIHRGIKSITKKINSDPDYKVVTERIENAVFI